MDKTGMSVCLFVSRVSFRYCLMNVSVFAVLPIVLNLVCELPCGGILQRPGPLIHFTGLMKHAALIYFVIPNPPMVARSVGHRRYGHVNLLRQVNMYHDLKVLPLKIICLYYTQMQWNQTHSCMSRHTSGQSKKLAGVEYLMSSLPSTRKEAPSIQQANGCIRILKSHVLKLWFITSTWQYQYNLSFKKKAKDGNLFEVTFWKLT